MDGMHKVTEEHQMLRDLVKKFVTNELMPLEKNILERFAGGQPAALCRYCPRSPRCSRSPSAHWC